MATSCFIPGGNFHFEHTYFPKDTDCIPGNISDGLHAITPYVKLKVALCVTTVAFISGFASHLACLG